MSNIYGADFSFSKKLLTILKEGKVTNYAINKIVTQTIFNKDEYFVSFFNLLYFIVNCEILEKNKESSSYYSDIIQRDEYKKIINLFSDLIYCVNTEIMDEYVFVLSYIESRSKTILHNKARLNFKIELNNILDEVDSLYSTTKIFSEFSKMYVDKIINKCNRDEYNRKNTTDRTKLKTFHQYTGYILRYYINHINYFKNMKLDINANYILCEEFKEYFNSNTFNLINRIKNFRTCKIYSIQ